MWRVFLAMCRMLLLAVMAGALSGGTMAEDRFPVDLELVLAVDGSASVDYDEYRLQMHGIAAALRDPEILDAIQRGPTGQIAVTLMIWSGNETPVGNLDWYLISDAASAEKLASRLEWHYRPVRPGATAINHALKLATVRILSNEFVGARQIIDLSSDGKENAMTDHLAPLDQGRNFAVANNVTVNGLPILNDEPNLETYFADNIVGGTGAFQVAARDYFDFSRAFKEKLRREIEGSMLIGQLNVRDRQGRE